MDNGTTRRILLRKDCSDGSSRGNAQKTYAGGFQRPALSLAQYEIQTTRSSQIQYPPNHSIEFVKLQGQIRRNSRQNFTIIYGLHLRLL